MGSPDGDSGTDAGAFETVAVARRLFGSRMAEAEAYADLLTTEATVRGLLGPREAERVWERHILNCALAGSLLRPHARVADVGSGAGLPGIPLALARPDCEMTLVEPLARRVAFLEICLSRMSLPNVRVLRSRAAGVAAGSADVVTARAVAPLGDLAAHCLPLLQLGGVLLAIKGSSADAELARDRQRLVGLGGDEGEVIRVREDGLPDPTVVVRVRRLR